MLVCRANLHEVSEFHAGFRYYAQVGRDAARLNLRCVERSVIESTVRDREELLSVSLTVATADEIKLLFLEFQPAGVAFQ
jgi:hypothetical protein